MRQKAKCHIYLETPCYPSVVLFIHKIKNQRQWAACRGLSPDVEKGDVLRPK